ncbi:YusW family protein [Sporosarcina sp. ACRSM]|uniref:YusW family protein n=1 Tax=Sporosarcina sp. ACRSM TaxID=2918216 RepID=UPI001EF69B51|nr:YusW family protein [Sporosarcina sp. ACRSM]MCG7335667.1 YusW family protein [Sporosarcina sp. ACRSM]
MKKMPITISAMALALVLGACGTTTNDPDPAVNEPATGESGQETTNGTTGSTESTDSSVTNTPDTNAGTTTGQNTASQDEMQQKMDDIEYADFSLSVDYADHQEYEAELEKHSNNSVEAEIDDSLNQVKKKGTDAFSELYPLVAQLTITQQTSKADAIQEVMDVFKLPADYKELELEIKFKDGTKIEFEDRK